jgi:hypothetical protein
MSVREAVALAGLYLRLRHDFGYLHVGRSSSSFGKRGFYSLLARDLLPEAIRWLRYCPPNYPWKSSTNNLASAALVRVERALFARDHLHKSLLVPQQLMEAEDTLFYLDAILFSLSGAFDAAARVVHAACGISGSARLANWRTKAVKANSWTGELATLCQPIADLMALEKPGRDALEIVFRLRNSVHAEGLATVAYPGRADGDTTQHRLLLPDDEAAELLASFGRLGGLGAWGVSKIDSSTWSIEIPSLVESILPRVLRSLGAIMALTPVERLTTTPMGQDSFELDPHADSARARLRLLSGLGG